MSFEIIPTKKSFKNYLYFMFGQQFSLLGSGIIGFVITWWITIETQSAIYLSIATFLIFIPQVIVTPFAGVVADRISRKTIIMIVDSGQAILTLGLFFLFFFDLTDIWFILLIHTMRNVLFAIQVPAFQAIIPSMIPKDKLSRINGANFLFSGIIFMVGPILSALLLELFPITYIFLIDVVTYLIALIPLLLIKIPHQRKDIGNLKKEPFMKELVDGFKLVKSIPGLLALICFAMIFNFIFRPFNVLWPYYINITHGGTAFDLAFIFGAIQIGNIIGSIITTVKKKWNSKVKVNIIGESVFFMAYLLVIFAPYQQFYIMMLGGFLGAITFPITVATYLTIFQEVVPSDKIGRAMSIDHTLSMAIAPIGALIAGPAADFMGITNLYLICAIIGIINPILLWFFTKIRKLDQISKIEVKDFTDKKLMEIEMEQKI